MDGHFVPNITFGAPVVQCLRKHTKAVLDVHLMVSDPRKWIPDMRAAGADTFTFHIEVEDDIGEVIAAVKENGMKVGLALKPGTPVERVLPFVSSLDQVLIMTVEPGFGGQNFMSDMMPKVAFLRESFPSLNIQVDGGLAADTIDTAAAAGANMIVAGSAVFKGVPKDVIESLRRYIVKLSFAILGIKTFLGVLKYMATGSHDKLGETCFDESSSAVGNRCYA